MSSTFVVSWTGHATWAGPMGKMESAVDALSVVMGIRDIGMRDIVIRKDKPGGDWRTITVTELERIAEQEDRVQTSLLRRWRPTAP